MALFFAPEEKVSNLRLSLATTAPTPAEKCSVRRLASIVGKIICMPLAIGHAARLWMHGLYEMINHRVSWDEHPYLSELKFWQQQIGNLRGIKFGFHQGLPELLILLQVIVVLVSML